MPPVLATEQAENPRLARKLRLHRLGAAAKAARPCGIERRLSSLRPPGSLGKVVTPRGLMGELRAQLRGERRVLALETLPLGSLQGGGGGGGCPSVGELSPQLRDKPTQPARGGRLWRRQAHL